MKPAKGDTETFQCYVDSGLIWMGDPCYVFGEDASHGFKTWSDFCDRHEFAGQQPTQPAGEGVGLAIPSGYGDGCYPVTVTYGNEGRVSTVTIDFGTGDEPEDDSDYWDAADYEEELAREEEAAALREEEADQWI